MYFISSFPESMSDLHYSSQIQETKSHLQGALQQWHLKRLFSSFFCYTANSSYIKILILVSCLLTANYSPNRSVIKQMCIWLKAERCYTRTINFKRDKTWAWHSDKEVKNISLLLCLMHPRVSLFYLEFLWKALPYVWFIHASGFTSSGGLLILIIISW